MGIFKNIKKTYEDEYDLESMEELSDYTIENDNYNVDDDDEMSITSIEDEVKNQSVSELVNQFEKKYEIYNQKNRKKDPDVYIDNKKKKALSGYDKAYEAKKRAQEEEERFDQLLNSVQAKDLMNAVDKINTADKTVTPLKGEKLSGKLAKKEKEDEKRQLEIERNSLRKSLVNGAKSASAKEVYKEPKKQIDFDDNIQSKRNIDFEENYIEELVDNVALEQKTQNSVNNNVQKSVAKSEKANKNQEAVKHDDSISEYIRQQCRLMEDASINIDMSMNEYNNVTRQFSDVQIIEAGPDYMVDQLAQAAERVDNLTVDRRMYKSDEQKLSNNTYHRMEMLEDDFNKTLKYLEKEESYYAAVKRDMQILEGERLSLRIDAQNLTKRQLKVRRISIVAIISLVLVFAIFTTAMIILDDTSNLLLFVIITGLGAMIAVGLFSILRITEREVLVTEKKLNRATNLLNKVKIKYINAANALDYGYSKYGVKSSYELIKKFEAYLEMKEEQKRIVMLTSHLNEAEEELQSILRQLGVYDAQIWLTRVKALYNRSEMVEVRHKLTTQRQHLRKLIQDNEDLIEEAKCNIMKVTNNNPEYMNEALSIIEDFEKRSKTRKKKKNTNYEYK